ncbi:hypothetical protein BDR07DRAFT_1412048 [Suillus spraguei]|nr:hypothetical protein BDR07DRAFT_1412048 [Suillus spraguei]
MATFGKSSFNTAIYATFRPTYPRSLYDFIFRYHERNKVDLGCGTGQATVELTPFKKTLVSTGQYEYVQASAESPPFLEDSSMDLVIAAQASH